MISLCITEAKIVYPDNEDARPRKYYNEHTGDFQCFKFGIYPIISKKNKDGQWVNKAMPTRCVIWNERVAVAFMADFDPSMRNYITIVHGKLTNFHEEKIQRTSKSGSPYDVPAFSYPELSVQDFVITHRPFGQENQDSEPAQKDGGDESIDDILL